MPVETTDEVQAKLAEARSQGRICPLKETQDGWNVLTVHWSAVPSYDFAAACRGLSDEGIQAELELNWHASTGKRVYPTFGRKHHVASEPLVFNPHGILYCGWDFGGNSYAMVPTQLNNYGQWLIFPPVITDEDRTVGTYEFGQMVADHLLQEYALPHHMTLDRLRTQHYGDPMGAGPPARTGDSRKEIRSHFDILRRGIEIDLGLDERGHRQVEKKPGWGWRIRPGAVDITQRLEAVRARLALNVANGHAALVVDPRAEIVIEAFLGGYHYKQREDGRYEYDPEKNEFSHVCDAFGYVATRLFTHGNEEFDEDEEGERVTQEFRSHASGWRRGR